MTDPERISALEKIVRAQQGALSKLMENQRHLEKYLHVLSKAVLHLTVPASEPGAGAGRN